jgi:hypothetical protein
MCVLTALAADNGYTNLPGSGMIRRARITEGKCLLRLERQRASPIGSRGRASLIGLARGAQNAIVMKRNASMNTRVLMAPTTRNATTARVSLFSDMADPLGLLIRVCAARCDAHYRFHVRGVHGSHTDRTVLSVPAYPDVPTPAWLCAVAPGQVAAESHAA